jgi:membrane protease YdiL (CAAX protease family)
VAPDPVALFILALVLGTLYYRTHRIVPSIVTHAAFNATTLLLLWGITPS